MERTTGQEGAIEAVGRDCIFDLQVRDGATTTEE